MNLGKNGIVKSSSSSPALGLRLVTGTFGDFHSNVSRMGEVGGIYSKSNNCQPNTISALQSFVRLLSTTILLSH